MRAIAFVGSHSSGKSTVIDEYTRAHSGQRLRVISGLPRAIIDRGFPLEKNATVDSFTNYVRDQLRKERMVGVGEVDLLLSDRTVLDAAAYAKVNAALPRPSVPSYFVEMLLEVALLEAARYDLFVYCPVEFPMTPDPFRPSDEPYRERVGLQIRAFLDEHTLPYVTASGDVSDRLSKIVRAIENLNG